MFTQLSNNASANNVEFIKEVKVDGYTAKITSDEETGFVITNSHKPEVTSATVKKVWDDANNQDGKRPESLEVELSNGKKVTLNAENEWTATVENLPVYANGEKIAYTWTEGKMPEADNGF